MYTAKRKRAVVDRSDGDDSDDSDSDLLKHLDEHRQLQVEAWRAEQQRVYQQGATGDNAETMLSGNLLCYRYSSGGLAPPAEIFQVVTAGNDDTANRIEQSAQERRKEMNRIRQRRCQLKKRAKLARAAVASVGGAGGEGGEGGGDGDGVVAAAAEDDHVMPAEEEVADNRIDQLLEERRKEMNRIRQRRYQLKKRAKMVNAAVASVGGVGGEGGDGGGVVVAAAKDDHVMPAEEEVADNRIDQLLEERRKEMNRIRQRRFRLKRRAKLDSAAVAGVGDEVVAGVAEEYHVMTTVEGIEEGAGERNKKLNRNRQQQYRQKHAKSVKNETCQFDNELSSRERAHCMEELQRTLGPEGLDECVCASCDRLVLRCVSRRVNDADLDYLSMMTKALHVDTSKLPEALVNQYRPPDHVTTLHGAMVSPRAIHTYTNDDNSLRSWLLVCNECDNDIQHGRLPKFAIANGFFIGRLPQQLRNLTLPERFMTQLASVGALTRVMRGGRHRCIRSHCIAFDCTPGPPISLLPRSLAGVSSYRVVMVGEFTAGQVDQVRKLHRIRNESVRDVFEFYKSNNHLYADISENGDVTNSVFTDDRVEQVFVEHIPDPDGNLDDEMNGEQQSVRGESDAWRVLGEENECRVIERRIGLADDGTPAVELANLTTASANESDEREFEVRRSNHIANDISGNLLARMFPHLFPFGRGGPGEHRRISVSVQERTKYYSMLSGLQFAEDELFLLVAFDRISLSNMYIQNHIRCQRFPHLLEGYENLSAEQLGQALLENERRRQGCLPWKSTEDTVAQRFLKTVEIGTRSVWGSNAERAQCRHKAFAYQARFGQPALFITLTPNTDNSLVLAQYTGISSLLTPWRRVYPVKQSYEKQAEGTIVLWLASLFGRLTHLSDMP